MPIFWWPLGRGSGGGGLGPAPATPTLSVTDNGNGTGGVATVGNTSGSTSNAVYTQSWPSAYGAAGTWTLRGTRTGNGTVVLTLPVGTYLVQVVSTLNSQAAPSGIAPLGVTDTSSDELYYRCLMGVRTVLQGAGLTGIGTNVFPKKLTFDRQTTLPCVIVSFPEGSSETEPGDVPRVDGWTFPVLVTLVAANNQDLTVKPSETLWRKQVRDTFHQQPLAGVPEVWLCEVKPARVVDRAGFKDANLLVSQLLVVCYSRTD